nr:transposase [Ferrithrix thermotolerans]
MPVERTAELLGDVLAAPVSAGWLCNLQAEAAGKLAPFLAEIKGRLAAEPVICADETGTRVGNAKQWVHTVATGLLTPLVVHPKRKVEAMRDIGIFEHYTGTIVHDGLAAYDTYSTAGHAQRKAFNLATRIRNNQDQVLRLLGDTRIPFTNDDAERSLRMVKIHDKISGTFQSAEGAARFAAVRSYLQTADAHGHNLLDACRQLFTTGPWIPPPAVIT